MSAMSWQLDNPEATGSYILQCGLDELLTAVEKAGFALIDVDLKGINGKKDLLDAIARKAGFPPDFGSNWDALADALCDMSWIKSTGYVLLLRNASDTLGLSPDDRKIIQEIFSDTVIYWRKLGKPFWIFSSR